MAKKYVPSGYQIIDLGAHNLSSQVTINKGENADADVLIDLLNSGRIKSKPILLHLIDDSESYDMTGFTLLMNSETPAINLLLTDFRYIVIISNDKVEIVKESV